MESPQFRKHTQDKSEMQIQAEIRPLIIRYLEDHFRAKGFKDAVAKANQSFYWEGQDGRYGKSRAPCFGTRNYPDFIITAPYVVAVEYKQSPNGSTVKHGIGQSIMHTLSGEFHFVYYLFHDESPNKQIGAVDHKPHGIVHTSRRSRTTSTFTSSSFSGLLPLRPSPGPPPRPCGNAVLWTEKASAHRTCVAAP